MRLAIAALLLLTLTACGLFADKETRALRRTPDYQQGYSDGCNSAYGPDANQRQDTMVRDAHLYSTSRAYQMGWRRGNGACRPTGYSGGALPGTMPGSGPIRDPNPGNGSIP